MHNGPSRSSKVVDFGTNRKRVCDFLLVINSKLGPISPVSDILQIFDNLSMGCAIWGHFALDCWTSLASFGASTHAKSVVVKIYHYNMNCLQVGNVNCARTKTIVINSYWVRFSAGQEYVRGMYEDHTIENRYS